MLDQLLNYAKSSNPERDIPSSVRLIHDRYTITLFDLYPKSKYHFLIFPRLPLTLPTTTSTSTSPSTTPSEPDEIDYHPTDLHSLRTLLAHPQPLDLLRVLQRAAEDCVEMIEDEMRKTEGFVWEVWVGFHSVPSMKHVHLHIISSDLVSPCLKTKKHFNSFHPELGFFIPLDVVIQNLTTSRPSWPKNLLKSPDEYELLLKTEMRCPKCRVGCKNIPELKAHLKDEWEREKERKGKGKVVGGLR